MSTAVRYRSLRPTRWFLALLLCALASQAHADIFRPAYLELREAGDDRFDVLWKVPAQSETVRLALHVQFPPGTQFVSEPRGVFIGDSIVERWQIRRPGGLAGQSIRIEGPATGITNVIARVERSDGTSQLERLGQTSPEFIVAPTSGASEIAWSYLVLGIEHILGGIDHLLFVLALLLIVRGGRRIIATVTAFTVAHSITLAAATLGWVHVPGPPVEALIALSIAFVAAEVIQGLRGEPGLTARAPWVVAFSFGLLHGFGFASALAQVGLPQKAIPIALLLFNVGVEVGQLLFVATVLILTTLVRRQLSPTLPRIAQYAMPYAIGTVAMFWVIERLGSFWH